MATKLQKFSVTARLVLIIGIDIKAESYEDALKEAETLKETDFVKILGDFNDGSIRIVNVGKDEYWHTDDY